MTYPTRQVTATFDNGAPMTGYTFTIILLTLPGVANGEIVPPQRWPEVTDSNGQAVFNLPVSSDDQTAYNYRVQFDNAQTTDFALLPGAATTLSSLLTQTNFSAADDLTQLQGASAYEIWLAEGNTGDTAAFLASLIGATGPAGTLPTKDPQVTRRLGGLTPLVFPSVWPIGAAAANTSYADKAAFSTALHTHILTLYPNMTSISVDFENGTVTASGSDDTHTLPDDTIASAAPSATVSGSDTITMTQADALGVAKTTSDTTWGGSLTIRLGDGDGLVSGATTDIEGEDYFMYETGLQNLGTDLNALDAGTWEDAAAAITPGGLLGGSFAVDWDALSDASEYTAQYNHVQSVDNSDDAVFDSALQTRIETADAAGGPYDATLQTDLNTALTAASLDNLPTFATGQQANIKYTLVSPSGAVFVAELEIAST